MPESIVDVAAGVIVRADGKLLLGQRPEGKPWSGWWELPGGKVEPGETVQDALSRELREEIGIRIHGARPWVTYVHRYPEKTVRLSFCLVTQWDGEPEGLESQDLAWTDVADAQQVGALLPATLPVLRWLTLPTRYAITAICHPDALPQFLERLRAALDGGLRLLQLREPDWPGGPAAASLHDAMTRILEMCRASGARVLINSVHPRDWAIQADGWHLRTRDAAAYARTTTQALSPPSDAVAQDAAPAGPSLRDGFRSDAWIGVSAHDQNEVATARALGADFVVLGSVRPTASHPGQAGMGWAAFSAALADAGLPAFAIGGQSSDTIEQAWAAGAHGVAGIRAFI